MKTKELKISHFIPEHQEEARRLILEGLGEHWGWIDEQINTDLEDIEASYSTGHFMLGWLDETLVATGALIPEDRQTSRIVRMSVAKRFRRQGFGRQILDHLLAIAHKTQTEKVILETTETWKDAIAFYRSCGFQMDAYRGGNAHMFICIGNCVR